MGGDYAGRTPSRVVSGEQQEPIMIATRMLVVNVVVVVDDVG